MTIYISISFLFVYLLLPSKNLVDSIDHDHTRSSDRYYDSSYINPPGLSTVYPEISPYYSSFNPDFPLNSGIHSSYYPNDISFNYNYPQNDLNYLYNVPDTAPYYPHGSYYDYSHLGHIPVDQSLDLPYDHGNSPYDQYHDHHRNTSHHSHTSRTGRANPDYYIGPRSSRRKYIHHKFRPRSLKHKTRGYWVDDSKHTAYRTPRSSSLPKPANESSSDDGFIPIPNRSGSHKKPGHMDDLGSDYGFIPIPSKTNRSLHGPPAAPNIPFYGQYPPIMYGSGYPSPGYPLHPPFTHNLPPPKPSNNLIILDIGLLGSTSSYSMTIDGSKKIFTANTPFLFSEVTMGSEVLWTHKQGDYPNKVVYEVVNDENQVKVYFPTADGQESTVEPEPESPVPSPDTKDPADTTVQTPSQPPKPPPIIPGITPVKGLTPSTGANTISNLTLPQPCTTKPSFKPRAIQIPNTVLNSKPTIHVSPELARQSTDFPKNVFKKNDKGPGYKVMVKERVMDSGFNFYAEYKEPKIVKILCDGYEEQEDLGCNYFIFNKGTNCSIIKFDGQTIWQRGDYDIYEPTSASYDKENGFIIVGNNYKGLMYRKDKEGVWRFYSYHFYSDIEPPPKTPDPYSDLTPTISTPTSSPTSSSKTKSPIKPHVLNKNKHLKYFKLYALDSDTLVQLGENDYVLKQELNDNYFIINDRVNCVLVQYEGYDVWKRGDMGISYPSSVCFNPEEKEISVSDLKKAVIYKMDEKGDWNYYLTTRFGPNMIPLINP